MNEFLIWMQMLLKQMLDGMFANIMMSLELFFAVLYASFVIYHLLPEAHLYKLWLAASIWIATLFMFFIIWSGDQQFQFRDIVFLLFTYGAAFFVLLSEIMLSWLAAYLTKKRKEKWIKEMDYIYLSLGAIGVVGSVNKLEGIIGSYSKMDLWGPVVIVSAIVIRFLKTRADIGGWNKLPAPSDTSLQLPTPKTPRKSPQEAIAS